MYKVRNFYTVVSGVSSNFKRDGADINRREIGAETEITQRGANQRG